MRVDYIGNFGFKDGVNGQTVKTVAIEWLFRQMGICVVRCDSSRRPLRTLVVAVFRRGRIHAVSLGKRGLLIYLLLSFCFFDWSRRRHFFIIGGWFLEYSEIGIIHFMFRSVSRRAKFYVESQAIAVALNKVGFDAVVFPNFRNIVPKVGDRRELSGTVKLIFVSRLIAEKGVFEAIELVERLNRSGCPAVLDIYGSGIPEFLSRIDERLVGVDYIRRKPPIPTEKVTEMMGSYDFLLLPTYYRGECMPGVVVEAFSTGLPVVATRWRFMSEMVDHGVNGVLFEREYFVEGACQWILDMTKEKHRVFCERAYRTFKERYTVDVASQIIFDHMLLQEIVDHSVKA